MSTIGIALALLPFLLMSDDKKQDQDAAPTRKQLERRLDDMEQRHKDEIDDLQGRIDDLEGERDTTAAPGEPDRGWLDSLNAFNPSVTGFGNFIGRLDDKRVENEDGDPIDDRFSLREVELDLRASIDPWADGVIILASEAETPGDFSTGIEESYIVLKKMPGLDDAPLGTRFKAGRFRPRFGRMNQIHTHDLPQTTRPRSLQTFLGEEGYIQDGIALDVLIPTPGESNAMTLDFGVHNGGDIGVGEDNGGEDMAFSGRLGCFVEPCPGHEIDIGVSGWHGRFDADGSLTSHLYGLDAMYMWRPPSEGQWHSFLVGGEVYYAEIERDMMTDASPLGGYVWSQVQACKNLYINGRFDYTEDLTDTSMETRTAGCFVSYYTTEFLRFRCGYERTFSDDPDLDNLDTFFFEINFIIGSHPAEPYWVNR